MASMTDEDLLRKLKSLNVPDLRQILRTCGVPHSAYAKPQLVNLAYYAIRLGLEALPTEKEDDKVMFTTYAATADHTCMHRTGASVTIFYRVGAFSLGTRDQSQPYLFPVNRISC